MANVQAEQVDYKALAEKLAIELRAMTHLAGVLNGRQHAGSPITAPMWSMLYQITNRAKGVLAEMDPPDDHPGWDRLAAAVEGGAA